MSTRIGQIEYFGSARNQNSKIFEGIFRRSSAIKVRIVENTSSKTEEEVRKLLYLESHPNVQRVFGYERQGSLFYIGLRSFDITLEDHFKVPVTKRKKMDTTLMIKNITDGLKFLHDNKVVHDYISFSNIGINYSENIAMLCNYGLESLQEDIFVTPEELSGQVCSFPADVFNLGIVVYFILSNGCHPFGALSNSTAIIDNIKATQFDCKNHDFKTLISEKLSHKIESAIYLLKKMLTQDPEHRITCDEIVKHPFFWNNREVYKYFRLTHQSWKVLSVEDKKVINDKWSCYCNKLNLQNVDMMRSYMEMSLVELVKFIAEKVRHFEDSLFFGELKDEHILHYITQLPFLLPFMHDLSSDSVQSLDKFKDLTISGPKTFEIDPKDVECGRKLYANIFGGKFKSVDVTIKRTTKENSKHFNAELKNIEKLTSRKDRKQDCKSCKSIECENVLRFFGLYEEPIYLCIVLEKFEETIGSFLKSNNKNIPLATKILFDAVKGLECLHANSIAHLNLNPHNILIVKRRGTAIGCLANFGRVEEVVTDDKASKEDNMAVYIAPELMKKSQKNTKVDYSKCDIYSLGVLFKTDFLSFLLNLRFSKCHSKEDLRDLRKDGKVSFLFEELVNFMTEEAPLKRPNAEGVRKNPFFWNSDMKIQFLRNVSEYVKSFPIGCKIAEIEERALNKLFIVDIQQHPKKIDRSGNRKKQTEGWIDFLDVDERVYAEVMRFIGRESRKASKDGLQMDKSIFCLVKLIVSIHDDKGTDDFKNAKAQLNASNLDEYLDFWLRKYELIGFLYYVMEEYMNKLYPSFYSTQTPKRVLGNRRMSSVLVERPNVRRNLCEIDGNGGGSHF